MIRRDGATFKQERMWLSQGAGRKRESRPGMMGQAISVALPALPAGALRRIP
jgi:hypothetical protein